MALCFDNSWLCDPWHAFVSETEKHAHVCIGVYESLG